MNSNQEKNFNQNTEKFSKLLVKINQIQVNFFILFTRLLLKMNQLFLQIN